eukprot:g46022.t1
MWILQIDRRGFHVTAEVQILLDAQDPVVLGPQDLLSLLGVLENLDSRLDPLNQVIQDVLSLQVYLEALVALEDLEDLDSLLCHVAQQALYRLFHQMDLVLLFYPLHLTFLEARVFLAHLLILAHLLGQKALLDPLVLDDLSLLVHQHYLVGLLGLLVLVTQVVLQGHEVQVLQMILYLQAFPSNQENLGVVLVDHVVLEHLYHQDVLDFQPLYLLLVLVNQGILDPLFFQEIQLIVLVVRVVQAYQDDLAAQTLAFLGILVDQLVLVIQVDLVDLALHT